MAGKSTVMRGTMAVALLGACGLFAPCTAARVPFIDAFMLRTFSADSPIEGLSSFAIEMTEMRCHCSPPPPLLHMHHAPKQPKEGCHVCLSFKKRVLLPRYVLEDAGADALVLVDELGKGTEVRAGTALAAAFLERLAALNCKGIFATYALSCSFPLHANMLALRAHMLHHARLPVAREPHKLSHGVHCTAECVASASDPMRQVIQALHWVVEGDLSVFEITQAPAPTAGPAARRAGAAAHEDGNTLGGPRGAPGRCKLRHLRCRH